MAKRHGRSMNDNDEHGRTGQDENRPWAELRSGMLKATVWENETKDGEIYFSTVLVRVYQNGDSQWRETHGLGRDDLLRAANLLRRTFDAIEAEQQQRREASRA
jgi:hypothetical protein